MGRAQLRDASSSQKFFFRKNIFREGSSRSSSVASSVCSSPVDGEAPKKEKKLRNCFPTVPAPENGAHRGPVEREYAEMSMNEIMNGDVSDPGYIVAYAAHFQAGWIAPRAFGSCLRLSGYTGC